MNSIIFSRIGVHKASFFFIVDILLVKIYNSQNLSASSGRLLFLTVFLFQLAVLLELLIFHTPASAAEITMPITEMIYTFPVVVSPSSTPDAVFRAYGEIS